MITLQPASTEPDTYRSPFSGQLRVSIATPEQEIEVAQWFKDQHFLGECRKVGHSLVQIVWEDDQPCAALLWGACAFKLKDRDQWIDWPPDLREQRLKLIVQNRRFLVLDQARRPNLASAALGAALRSLPGQWEQSHQYQPLLAETFSDPECHEGTVYKVTNWLPIGQSAGYSRHRTDFYLANERPKKLWLYPLRKDARGRLNLPELAALHPEHAAGISGKPLRNGAKPALPRLPEITTLYETLNALPDPRSKHARRYCLGSLLSLIVFGMMLGGRSLAQIHRLAEKLNRKQRLAINLNRGRRWVEMPIPSYSAFRDILLGIDPEAFALHLSRWLSAGEGKLPGALALDGKSIRSELGQIISLVRHDEGTPLHLAVATPPETGHELPVAQELLKRDDVQLDGAVVTADALHCQEETLRAILEKGGDYIVSLKDNQPTAAKTAREILEGAPFFRQNSRPTTDASSSEASR